MALKRLLAIAAIIIQETSSAPTAPLCRDKKELDALLATHQPLALMVLPRGCDMFPGTCGPLGEFWGAVARAFPGRNPMPRVHVAVCVQSGCRHL